MRGTLRGRARAKFLARLSFYEKHYSVSSGRSLASRLGIAKGTLAKWKAGGVMRSSSAYRVAEAMLMDYEADLSSSKAVLCPESSFDVIQEALMPAMTQSEATAVAMYCATLASDWLGDSLDLRFSVPAVVRLPAREPGARIDVAFSAPAQGVTRTIKIFIFCRHGRLTYEIRAEGHPRRQIHETGLLTDAVWVSKCDELLKYVKG